MSVTTGDLITAAMWNALQPKMTLLTAGSGTSTAAGATDVDTVAISGLTALDTLQVFTTVESVTQATAGCLLLSTTDAVTLTYVVNGAVGAGLAAGVVNQSTSVIRMRQGSTTAGMGTSTGSNTSVATLYDGRTFTLASWTGSWTLALRHAGVTAGGTFKYNWAVYKVAGQ